MRSNVFQDAVESSTKVFGRKSDVRVVFEGGQARTDGNMIVLPALPASAEITVDQQDIIRGYRDHESMHVRCTDTSSKAMKRLDDMTNRSKGLGALVQFCEDIRIENAAVQAYPGMKHTLSATNKQGAKMMLQQVESKGDAASVLVTLPKPLQFRLVLQQVGRSLIGVDSDGIFEKMSEVIKANDPALYALAEQYGKRMAELPTGYSRNALSETVSKRGTTDSFELAEEIYAAYGKHEEEQAAPPPPPPPPSQPQPQPPEEKCEQQPGDAPPPSQSQQAGSGDGSDDGEDGDGVAGDEDGGTQGSGDSDGEEDDYNNGEEDDDRPGEGEGDGDEDGDEDDGDGDEGDGADQGGSQGDGSQSQSQAGSNGHGNGMDAEQPDEFGVDDLHNKALQGVVNEISHGPDVGKGRVLTKGVFNVWSSRFSIKLPIIDAVLRCNEVDQQNEPRFLKWADQNMVEIDRALTGKRAMIRRILELELQARNDRKWESGFKSGRLQSVRLVQALQGRETVYQKRQDGKDMDTLLYISIDGSGSMTNGTRAKDAVTLAYALAEALERTGCDIVVEMWGNVPISKGQHPASTYTKAEYEASIVAMARDIRGRQNKPGYTPKYVSPGVLTRGVLKTKRQRTTDPLVRQGFGMAVRALASGTPSFHAVFADLKDMSKENHAKRVYLHITDGDSDDPLEGQDRTAIMKEAQAYADAAGVHMIGVGISGMSVSHLFKDFIEVSGSDAYEPVIRKLSKLVAQEAGHAANFKRQA